jgi:hypothetical protein
MPTRIAPPSSPAQELIDALAGYKPPTETTQQTAAQELLAELFGINVETASERWEDYYTAHEVRRRPEELAYNPIPPQPGPFDQFPVMEWVQADSSNVDRAAYNEETSQMFVQFLSGAIYRYEAVPPSIWADYLASNSKGMFVWYILRNNGRDNRFAYENIRTGTRVIRRGPEAGRGRVTPMSRTSELRGSR